MWNGVLYFKYTPYGWMLHCVFNNGGYPWGRELDRYGDYLRVAGDFIRKPKHGYCKRPHQLLA